jgi:hypothetical protein
MAEEKGTAVLDEPADDLFTADPVTGTGVTPEDIYGKPEGTTDKPAKGQEPEDKKGESSKAGEGDADEPEAKKGAEWDKNRQALDQEKANRVKAENELKDLRAETAQMQESLNRLVSQNETLTKAKAPPKGPVADAEELVALTEESDIGTVERRMNEVATRKVKEMADRMSAKIDSKMDSMGKKIDEVGGEVQAMGDDRILEELQVRLDREHGPQFRNQAVSDTNQYFKDKGLGLPTPSEFNLALEMQYLKLAQAEKDKKGKDKPKKDAHTVDSGTGGSVPRVEVGNETLDEAVAAMTREGKWGRSGSG